MLPVQVNIMQRTDSHLERQDPALELKNVKLVELRSLLLLYQAQANTLMEIILLMVHLSVSDLQLEREKEVQINRCQDQDNTMTREPKALEKMRLKFL